MAAPARKDDTYDPNRIALFRDRLAVNGIPIEANTLDFLSRKKQSLGAFVVGDAATKREDQLEELDEA